MFIKFDEYDLTDFFEKEPINIGDEEEARFIYSIKDSQMIVMTLTVDTYMQTIDICISNNNNTIFGGQFEKVNEIEKSGDVLLVNLDVQKRLVLKKSPCVGAIIENV